MHPLWKRLESLSNSIVERFNEHFVEYHEEAMDGLKFEDWSDRFWTSNKVYKAHLKTISPKDGKGLWLMHVNVFPQQGVELPILGFDIVAGPKKITGSFMDFSPLHGFPHPYHDYMEARVKNIEWNKPRELPSWAKEIFSDDMIAVGNINTDEELDQFIQVTSDLVDYYLHHIEDLAFSAHRDTTPMLNKYCQNQKMNPHLHRSILAMGISEEDKNRYVNDVLFKEIIS